MTALSENLFLITSVSYVLSPPGLFWPPPRVIRPVFRSLELAVRDVVVDWIGPEDVVFS